MYLEAFHQMSKQLGQIAKWLDAAAAYAESRKFDPNVFVTARLAPDQLAFARQIQIACDTAKLGAARLIGKEKEAPSHPDTEATLGELRARIASVQAYLGGLTSHDFEGAGHRTISTPRWEGKTMTGANFFREHVTPNFYFHVTTTYALLRHNGVPLGKKDYLGELTMTPA